MKPQSIEAEKSLIGSMFLDKYAYEKACDLLTSEHFSDERNRAIFTGLKNMNKEGAPVDITTLTTHLSKNKLLDKAGGVEYISDIISYVPTAANFEQYLKDVESSYILRRLIDVADDIKTSAYNPELGVNNIIDTAERNLLNVIKNKQVSNFKKVSTVLEETEERIEFLAQNKKKVTGLPTGITDFDNLTSGLKGGQIIIIGARPSVGKTALAVNIAVHAAVKAKKTVAFFELEMPANDIVNRMLSTLGQINGAKLNNGSLNSEDWKKFNEAMNQLSPAELYIDDTQGITVGEIRSKCRKLAASETGLDLIVLDHMQLVETAVNYGSNRQLQVADISRSLKMLAMELDVPIVVLSQLSRPPKDKAKPKAPALSDLRDSGAIEQDADIVAFLHREDYFDNSTFEDNSETELIVAKHRQGGLANIKLIFKKSTSTFLSVDFREG